MSRKRPAADRTRDHAVLRSVGFRTWIDDTTLRVIKHPNDLAPPSMTLTGRFDRVERSIVLTCVAFQGTVFGLPFRVSHAQIRQALDRLLRLHMIECIYESPPPPPKPWTEQERRTMIVLTPFGRFADLERERARQARVHAMGRGKTYYRAIGLLEAIARAAQ